MEKAVIDLVGKSKATVRLTFECLSRALRSIGVAHAFARLSEVGDKLALKIRLRGYMHLKVLAGETLVQHRA